MDNAASNGFSEQLLMNATDVLLHRECERPRAFQGEWGTLRESWKQRLVGTRMEFEGRKMVKLRSGACHLEAALGRMDR
jgi:hypothetical protein